MYYKKVESEAIVNSKTIEREIEEHRLSKINIDDEEVNPNHNIIINNLDRENVIASQMEPWSILTNIVNYVQYNRHPKDFYIFDIKAIDQKNHRKIYDWIKKEDREVLELDFGDNPDKLRGGYLDMYQGVMSEVLSTTKFDGNSDVSITYLGRIDMTRVPMPEQGYTVGKE